VGTEKVVKIQTRKKKKEFVGGGGGRQKNLFFFCSGCSFVQTTTSATHQKINPLPQA
jgi:hypothetical protein